MVAAGWDSSPDPAGTIQVQKTWKKRAGQSVEARLCLRTRTSPLRTRPCSVTAPRPLSGCRETSPGYAHRLDPVPWVKDKCLSEHLVCLFCHVLLLRSCDYLARGQLTCVTCQTVYLFRQRGIFLVNLMVDEMCQTGPSCSVFHKQQIHVIKDKIKIFLLCILIFICIILKPDKMIVWRNNTVTFRVKHPCT